MINEHPRTLASVTFYFAILVCLSLGACSRKSAAPPAGSSPSSFSFSVSGQMEDNLEGCRDALQLILRERGYTIEIVEPAPSPGGVETDISKLRAVAAKGVTIDISFEPEDSANTTVSLRVSKASLISEVQAILESLRVALHS